MYRYTDLGLELVCALGRLAFSDSPRQQFRAHGFPQALRRNPRASGWFRYPAIQTRRRHHPVARHTPPVETIFSHKPTLEGNLVRLRPNHGQDAEVIQRLIQDRDIAVLTGSVHSRTPQQSPWSVESLRAIYQQWSTSDDRLVLAVIEQKTEAMVGEVVLNDLHEENRSCGFRTLIGPDGRGKGLGTEATRMIIRHGLQTLGLHRISLEVYDFNPRARHVYDKVGFTHEGTGRDALRFEDRWIDVHYMSILDTDIY